MNSTLPQRRDPPAPRHPHRGRWVAWLLVAFVATSALGTWLAARHVLRPAWLLSTAGGWFPPQMVRAQHTPSDVVGDLGGMPVRIPRGIAEFVEYDGDPGFGERRIGPTPTRTTQSKLQSFGFEWRYPDGATLDDPAARRERRPMEGDASVWIHISIISGQIYPKDGFLDRAVAYQTRRDNPYPSTRYERVPSPYAGLESFAVLAIDPQTGKPYRDSIVVKTLFVARGDDGKVLAYMHCTRPDRYSLCQQFWSLERLGIQSEVKALYPLRLIVNWKEIQEGGTRKLLEFKTPSN